MPLVTGGAATYTTPDTSEGLRIFGVLSALEQTNKQGLSGSRSAGDREGRVAAKSERPFVFCFAAELVSLARCFSEEQGVLDVGRGDICGL